MPTNRDADFFDDEALIDFEDPTSRRGRQQRALHDKRSSSATRTQPAEPPPSREKR